MTALILNGGLFVLAVLSGMLGLGVAFLAYRLLRPVTPRATGEVNFRLIMNLAVPISVLAG